MSMGAAMTIGQQVHASRVPTKLPCRAKVSIRRADMGVIGEADGKADDGDDDDVRMEPDARRCAKFVARFNLSVFELAFISVYGSTSVPILKMLVRLKPWFDCFGNAAMW